MRWKRMGLIALALLVAQALLVDLAWLYRFATIESCPPMRSCLGWPSPWECIHYWLTNDHRFAELPKILFKYQWSELMTLLSAALILAAELFWILRRLGFVRLRFRLRSVLLVVALIAIDWQAMRELWSAVDAWEATRTWFDAPCCLDTWIWGGNL